MIFKALQRVGLVVSMVSLLFGVLPVVPVQAADMGCSLNNQTAVVQPGTPTLLSFRITNTSATVLRWIRIARPSADFVISSTSVGGWSMAADDDGLLLTGGQLYQSNVQTVDVWVDAGTWGAGVSTWLVTAANDEAGAGAVTCSGAVETSIQADMPPGQAGVGISGQSVDTTTSSAIIRWRSDVPTGSAISYGTSAQYNAHTRYDPNFESDHLLVLGGLAPGTVYHYRTEGADENGAYVFSVDRTFTTVALPKPVTTPKPVTQPGKPTANTVAPSASAPDAQPPTIALETDLSRPFTGSVVVAGVAGDNLAVAKIDYSVNGGRSWVPVPNLPGLGTKSVHFSFAPNKLDDGNYLFVMRATDAAGNIARTLPVTMVIDLEPPRIGSELVAFGGQAAVLDASGRYTTAVGADQTITMNAVGGPTSIVVQATATDAAKRSSRSFYLRQDAGSGLWSGVMAFAVPGTYRLVAVARDGAGNQTTRVLNDEVVTAAAQIVAQGSGKPVSGATVTVYWRDGETGDWTPWDAAAYGGVNPQRTPASGQFAVVAPAGTYYLKVEAAGFQTIVTKAFTLRKVTPLVPVLTLKPRLRIGLGSWSFELPSMVLGQTSIDPEQTAAAGRANGLVGNRLPAFSLPSTADGIVTPVKLQGKPADVTVLATWAPQSADQLAVFAQVQARTTAVRVVPLYLGERAGKVQASLAQTGYGVSAITDEHATLGDRLGVPAVPTHYFVDRTGKVRSVYVGLLSADEILSRLVGL